MARSHSTVEVGGQEQAEIWAAHRVGGRPLVRFVDFQPGTAFEASCQGWSTPDVAHHRRFELVDGGLHIHEPPTHVVPVPPPFSGSHVIH